MCGDLSATSHESRAVAILDMSKVLLLNVIPCLEWASGCCSCLNECYSGVACGRVMSRYTYATRMASSVVEGNGICHVESAGLLIRTEPGSPALEVIWGRRTT